MKKHALLITAALLSASATQAESSLSYQNLTVGYSQVEVEIGNDDVDFSGLGFAGSMPISDNIFLNASYTDVQSDDEFGGDEIDISVLSFGAGFHAAVANNTDFVLNVMLDDYDRQHDNPAYDFDDTGRTLSLGVRSKVTPQIELAAALINSKLDDETENSIALSGRFFIAPKASLGLSWEDGDEGNAQTLDIRFDF